MLKLIIVDDEKIILETMKTVIDWESLSIEVVGLCQNGIEAYDMILDKAPDIVLLDICMPGLTGLELVRKLTVTAQGTQFIILSGYGEFAFAQEAMKLGIKHYLLKPCNENEIVNTVTMVKQDVKAYREQHPTPERENVDADEKKLLVNRVKQYTVEHIGEDSLSLKFIAESYLYMNVDYVSRKFYKESGEKFSAFLAKTRISLSKTLMERKPDMSVLRIAEAVGCGNNPQYFSQLFKKMEGITPREYKEKTAVK